MSQQDLLSALVRALQGARIEYMITGLIASSLQGEPRATHDIDRSRFARKYAEEGVGIRIKVSMPEDTILAKLHWSKLTGGSEKYFQDALRVYEVQQDVLDREYLNHWAEQLSVTQLLERIESEAERI